MNLYQYAHDDPTGRTDPDGHSDLGDAERRAPVQTGPSYGDRDYSDAPAQARGEVEAADAAAKPRIEAEYQRQIKEGKPFTVTEDGPAETQSTAEKAIEDIHVAKGRFFNTVSRGASVAVVGSEIYLSVTLQPLDNGKVLLTGTDINGHKQSKLLAAGTVLLPAVAMIAGKAVKVLKAGEAVAEDVTKLEKVEQEAVTAEKDVAGFVKKEPGSFVQKTESMSDEARAYQDAVTGAPSGQTYRVPYKNPNAKGRPYVDFDGVQGGIPIDSKVSVVTRAKTVNQASRQAEALRQAGTIGVWKVPTEAEARRAKAMIERANASDRLFVVVENPLK